MQGLFFTKRKTLHYVGRRGSSSLGRHALVCCTWTVLRPSMDGLGPSTRQQLKPVVDGQIGYQPQDGEVGVQDVHSVEEHPSHEAVGTDGRDAPDDLHGPRFAYQDTAGKESYDFAEKQHPPDGPDLVENSEDLREAHDEYQSAQGDQCERFH